MRSLLPALLFLLLIPAGERATGQDAAPVPCSPLIVVADPMSDRLFIGDATGETVLGYDIHDRKVTALGITGLPPTGLAVAPDGSALFLTSSEDGGKLVRFALRPPASPRVEVAASYPTAPVVSPDGKTLFVCNRFANTVEAYDASTLELRARIRVPREPIAAAITPDGKWLVVGQHLPDGAGDGPYSAAAVHIIDAVKLSLVATIPLENGSTSLRGVCVSPDGRYAFATHILARYHVPTTQIERGWINTNAVSILDLEKRERLNTVLLDDVGAGAANPWGVTTTPDGSQLIATHAGSHELSVIDLPGLIERLEGLGPKAALEVCNDLSFLGDLRRRVPLPGKGPRGLAVAAGAVWVGEYFSGSLAHYPLTGDAETRASSIPLTEVPFSMNLARRGELLFHDAGICKEQWQSCSSCHPDGRADALNWDLLNDGLGNPKNTKSMLLAHRTPPAMATGIRPDAKAAVRAGIRHIQFAVRPDEEAQAIDAYLRSLAPLRSPESLSPENAAAISRGAVVFVKAQCLECHPAPLFTDGSQRDLGTGRGGDEGRTFDTPTLIEIWRTAPYLHDGRAATLRAVLTEENPGDRHGKTGALTEEEVSDLVEYLRSL